MLDPVICFDVWPFDVIQYFNSISAEWHIQSQIPTTGGAKAQVEKIAVIIIPVKFAWFLVSVSYWIRFNQI